MASLPTIKPDKKDEPDNAKKPGKFIHLRVHTAYSLSEGAIKPKELVKLCGKHKMPAVGITDTNNMFGALEFAMAAADGGIQPIMGLQLAIERPDGKGEAPIILLAKNQQGFQNLQNLTSQAFFKTDGVARITLDDLQLQTDGLICLTGGPNGLLGALIQAGQISLAEEALHKLQALFPDSIYIELQRHESEGHWPPEVATESHFLKWADERHIPLVATNDCYFSNRDMYEAHDALLCIAAGRYVVENDRPRLTEDHYFKSADEMIALFADVPEAVANTVIIARRCAFMPKKLNPILPTYPDLPEGETEANELRRQAEEGLTERLSKLAYDYDEKTYRDRLDFECAVINKMGFAGYFLIVSDFIKWAKTQNIPVGPGRGSGAGSVVAWALTITDLDPLRFGLLFERFLNPERVSMPDFDVDFCQDRRDEVIRYVVGRYGYDRVAQIITFGKLQPRAVLRDVGRVLQIPYPVVDRICKLVPNNPTAPVTLQEAIDGEPLLRQARDGDEQIARMLNIGLKLEGLYRHASTHAAGVVIGDRKLTDIVPMYRDPRSDMPVTQYNMKMVELAGLVKFDFLGLKTLTVLQITVDFLKARGIEVDINNLPFDDRPAYELLSRADTTAVFQLESTGMRDVLRKMKPDTIEDIIALVSLYRPGPMDNIPTYIACKKGEEEPTYMHPLLEPVLKETFGIPVYQEQVMQIAQVLAGYSLGGADLLRRAMGKKIKEEMAAQRETFVKGAKEANNIDAGLANAIFDMLDKFASYGFNKSHAAAYALIAYQTAYLKANYPYEFLAASMTYDMGTTDKLAIFRDELKRAGFALLPPDVNYSYPYFTVEELPDGSRGIRYALAAIKGVGRAAMDALVEERKKNGKFKDLRDLALRCDNRILNKKQMESLTCAGALDGLHPNRAELMANMERILRFASAAAEERETGQENLFAGAPTESKLQLTATRQWDELTRLGHEADAIGFYLTAHPLDTYRSMLERIGVIQSSKIDQNLRAGGAGLVKLAGIPVAYRERTGKSGNKYAFATLTDNAGSYEFMVFSDLLPVAREALQNEEPVICHVSVQQRDGEQRMTLQRIEPISIVLAREGQGIRIQLSDEIALPKITEVLGSFKPGKGRITLAVALNEDHEAEFSLPKTYALTPAERLRLQDLPGIVSVEMA